jgi:Uma2 family endonuclease
MEWGEVIAHPRLQDLPFKIELNEYGATIMSPVKFKHSLYQGEIAFLLRALRSDGMTLVECAIKTPKGTKVADVAWASNERVKKRRVKRRLWLRPKFASK